MKKLKKISLQWRITLLTAAVLLICSVSITMFSMYSAEQMLYPLYGVGSVSDENGEKRPAAVGGMVTGESGKSYGAVLAQPARLQKQAFDMRGIWFCIGVTLLGTGAVYYVSGKALKPVRCLGKRINEIDENNLSQRLTQTEAHDEVGQLTGSFNRMLERMEDAFLRQKRFTASAAHEMKTPLATIKAGIQVLERDENADVSDYKENARIILKSTDRLSEMVDDLLYLASAQEEKEIEKEQVELEILLEAALSELAPLYEPQNITCTFSLQEKILVGNASMLYRAFYNLIENAYKYNERNGRIEIKSFCRNGGVWVTVRNTGKIIPREHLPFIFDAFYRADASRSRKTAGAGLGLSIVKTVVVRHGGEISVKSDENSGTQFLVRLPS